MPIANKFKRPVGRPPKYKTEEERKAARKASTKQANDKWRASKKEAGVKNITISSDSAVQFIEARDRYNAGSSLPFDLTNSQFLALILERWEKTGRKTEGGGA